LGFLGSWFFVRCFSLRLSTFDLRLRLSVFPITFRFEIRGRAAIFCRPAAFAGLTTS
jgi:hypothetical protein